MIENAEMKQKDLILTVITLEGILFLISLLWAYLAKINPFNAIHLNYSQITFAVFAGIILIVLNYLSVNVFSKYISFFAKLNDAYGAVSFIARNVNIWGALVIALLSGFTEEFFFRGLLQQQFGIIIASIVFGLLHTGNIKTFAYGIYAIIIGFYLGWLFSVTGNLLVPIIAHTLNNLFALPYMRYYYKKYVQCEGE